MSKKQTFHDRLLLFIGYLKLKPTSFEKEMGFSNGSIGKLLEEKRALGSDRLETIVSKYPKLSLQWLLTGEGEMINGYKNIDSEITISNASEPLIHYDLKTDNIKIPIVDIKAAAGPGYINTSVLKTNDFVQLPTNLVKKGKYLCIRIKGHSMSPTLQDGGFMVIRLLEKSEWTNLLSDRIYAVVDIENQTYLKRVRNRFTNGFIVLTSDNPDKATYPNFNLKSEEIVSIWYAEWYLSAKMPNIHDQFYSRLERLENTMEDLSRNFDQFISPKLKKP